MPQCLVVRVMNQHLRSIFEKHLNLRTVFHSGGDTKTENSMLHEITGSVPLAGAICFRERGVFSLQKDLVPGVVAVVEKLSPISFPVSSNTFLLSSAILSPGINTILSRTTPLIVTCFFE